MFDDDPFFAGHRQMMDSFFGGSGFGAIEDGGRRQARRRDVEPDQSLRRGRPTDPFEAMERQMHAMMGNMTRGNRGMVDMGSMEGDDGGHVFSHSSVYSYSSDGQGAPKVFQAAREERRGPGGVRETKKAVKDSTAGMQKMAVGHHLGDRGHVIERSQNLRTGDREEKQDFIGMTETEGAQFNDHWTNATNRHSHGERRQLGSGRGHRDNEERGGPSRSRALPPSSPRDDMLKAEGKAIKGQKQRRQ